ncbi:MAG: hypothetical protein KJ626_07200 [Verrucomicrobia bacterium]|nr:hypothetical protein [Verrucomicrobiota bacterium]
MSLGPVCKICGQKNDLARIFCTKCGAKLDLSHVEPAGAGSGSGRRLFRFVRLLVFLGLIAMLGLLLWPVEPAGRLGTREDARALYEKLRYVASEIKSGRAVTETASEVEINSYLAEIITRIDERPAGQQAPALSLDLQEINIQIKPEAVVVLVSAKRKMVTLSYEISGIPVGGVGSFAIDAVGVRMGHLPLPAFLRGRIIARIATIFRARDEVEKPVLDAADRFELNDGRITLIIESR